MKSFSQNNSNRGPALRPKRQAEYIGTSRSTLYSIEKKDPSFPPKFRLVNGGRATARFQFDLDDWLQQRAANDTKGA